MKKSRLLVLATILLGIFLVPIIPPGHATTGQSITVQTSTIQANFGEGRMNVTKNCNYSTFNPPFDFGCFVGTTFTAPASFTPSILSVSLGKIGTPSCVIQAGIWNVNRTQLPKNPVPTTATGLVEMSTNTINCSAIPSGHGSNGTPYPENSVFNVQGSSLNSGVTYAIGIFVKSNTTNIDGSNEPVWIMTTLSQKNTGGIGTGFFCFTGSCSSTDIDGTQLFSYPVIFSLFGVANPAVEPLTVLSTDDFLYKTQLPGNLWTIDSYTHVNLTQGIYAQAGYLVMRAQSANSLSSVHATNPVFTPSAYSNFTIIKRKMTATLFPFNKLESPFTAALNIGFSTLFTTGAYPGTSPAGTPSVGNGQILPCNPVQNGDEYFQIQNDGAASGQICAPGSTFSFENFGIIDPTLYTVLTLETYGIFCSGPSCTNNVVPGTSWVYLRLYQENGQGSVIASTDQNFNITNQAFISPYLNTVYAFASQYNSNSAATNQVSYLDFLQVQNFGSPVCIFNCVTLNIPTVSSPAILISGLGWVAGQIGFGDTGLGWTIIVIASMLVGFAGVGLYTGNMAAGAVVGILTLGLWLIAGVISGWLIVFPIIVAGFLGYGIFLKLTGTGGGQVQSQE